MDSFENLNSEDRKRISYLKSRDDCAKFARNVGAKHPHLVRAARQRSVELQVGVLNLDSELRRDIWSVVYAQEEALFVKHGKRLRAGNTRKVIDHRGELGAVAFMVQKPEGQGFELLHSLGLGDYTFEAVVRRNPEHFSPEIVEAACLKLEDRRGSEAAEVA
ncbi:hypothetical protein SB394_27565 [Burkholderia sp. BCCIQ04A]|uniref:Uncharacterized protein n=1 Tax=Burkholderia anthinoferrum TaxID=3090833 RepID=A0ABU5WLB7_9BURK|nr:MULTISPECIES: hypothetical protein [Burkholderia]MEB2503869.1 hypothetical protein [Burkholderia anthinoferrum]MEB2533291.1 hypothetical protein [Burkholderia anthinoferrum]MEB2561529.1 hypothetical protein [Burkholderia anthinoferrum]MEB2579561.1 hypothetical protein [Burkholderia anthinoferrum]MDF3099055.1 hypothetical protein [Burkholderia semiarida]